MNAREARRLGVGSWVIAYYGNARKVAQVRAINWPKFTCWTIDHKGQIMGREVRYPSLYPMAKDSKEDQRKAREITKAFREMGNWA